jgi:predicted hydrocarbon binding protein
MPDFFVSMAGAAKTVPQSGHFSLFPLPARARARIATTTAAGGTSPTKLSPSAIGRRAGGRKEDITDFPRYQPHAESVVRTPGRAVPAGLGRRHSLDRRENHPLEESTSGHKGHDNMTLSGKRKKMSLHGLAKDQVKPGGSAVVGPKEIVTMLYKQNHRLFQLAFKAELTSGPLIELSEVLRPMRVRIINATVSCPDGQTGTWNVFVDSEDFAITEGALRPKLEAMTAIRGLRIAGGDEFVVDELYFPIVMSTSGARVMLMTQESFQRMLSAMVQMFGSGASMIAYNEGLALGTRYAAGLRTLIRGDFRRFTSELAKLYSATGVGRCEFVVMDLEHLHFVVRLANSIECEGKHSEKPNSQWLRGHLAGGASVAFDAQMECKETKCAAMGDPYCEYELRKSQSG